MVFVDNYSTIYELSMNARYSAALILPEDLETGFITCYSLQYALLRD
jgi:hypothetical protein